MPSLAVGNGSWKRSHADGFFCVLTIQPNNLHRFGKGGSIREAPDRTQFIEGSTTPCIPRGESNPNARVVVPRPTPKTVLRSWVSAPSDQISLPSPWIATAAPFARTRHQSHSRGEMAQLGSRQGPRLAGGKAPGVSEAMFGPYYVVKIRRATHGRVAFFLAEPSTSSWLTTKLPPAQWPNRWATSVTSSCTVDGIVPGMCPRFSLRT